MKRSWMIAGIASVTVAAAVAACVGDDPTSSQGSSNDDAGPGNDATTSNPNDGQAPGDGAVVIVDSGVDAGPQCGYASEDCCAAPLQPCQTGTACVAAKCKVNDVWAVGQYAALDAGGFDTFSVSVHYDGTSWTKGPSMGFQMSSRAPAAIWGDAPSEYLAVTNVGEDLVYEMGPPEKWVVCSASDTPAAGLAAISACDDTATTQPLATITGFTTSDFWVAGTNTLKHCTSGSCASTTSGMPGTWSAGNLSGTSSTDLWYSQATKAFHYNGTTWTTFPSIQAQTIWAHTPSDVWAGNTSFQHFDGANWSSNFALLTADAAPPGIVFAMSGSGTNDVWAVGSGSRGGFSAHWNGTGWTEIPIVGSTTPDGVYAPGKDQAFATDDGHVWVWSGTAWAAATLPTIAPGNPSIIWNAITGSAPIRR